MPTGYVCRCRMIGGALGTHIYFRTIPTRLQLDGGVEQRASSTMMESL